MVDKGALPLLLWLIREHSLYYSGRLGSTPFIIMVGAKVVNGLLIQKETFNNLVNFYLRFSYFCKIWYFIVSKYHFLSPKHIKI